MQDSAIPAKFPVIWASTPDAGTFRTVPTAPPAQLGAASLQKGFPLATITPIAAGGSWPFGQDFNGILNQITAWQQWAQAGGPMTYDSAFSSAIGGYPKGALLAASSLSSVWLSTVDNNTTDPDTGGAGWLARYWGLTNLVVFNASTTWTAPAGVYLIYLEGVWGAGGGGGGALGFHSGGSAGGGGEWRSGFFPVVPGTAYTVTIGSGGTGGSGVTPSNGGPGGTTSFASFIAAVGGSGGSAGNGVVSTTPGAGGTGGSGGQDSNPGAPGSLPTEVVSGTIQVGEGGASGFGTPANLQSNTTISSNGAPGLSPGGGGCGGALTGNGGAGAHGKIRMWF